jgi:hypothetical protein
LHSVSNRIFPRSVNDCSLSRWSCFVKPLAVLSSYLICACIFVALGHGFSFQSFSALVWILISSERKQFWIFFGVTSSLCPTMLFSCYICTWILRPARSRVARFFLVQHTKTRKRYTKQTGVTSYP